MFFFYLIFLILFILDNSLAREEHVDAAVFAIGTFNRLAGLADVASLLFVSCYFLSRKGKNVCPFADMRRHESPGRETRDSRDIITIADPPGLAAHA